MLLKIGKAVLVGVGVGFAIGFTEEIILSAIKADDETRNKVSKVTSAATAVIAVATII